MRRWASATFTLVSAFLLILAAVAWVRSYDGDSLTWYDRPKALEINSSEGLVQVWWGEITSRAYPKPQGWQGTFWPLGDSHFSADLRKGTTWGFRYERWRRDTDDLKADSHGVTVRYWALVTLCSVWPGRAVWLWRRSRRRSPPGCCPNCGYDLRASPQRCPECGKVAAP